MANLLPEQEKKQQQKTYRLRLLSLLLLFLAALTAVGTLILFPSYMVTRSQERAALGQIALLEEIARERSKDERTEILVETRAKLDVVMSDTGEHNITDLVRRVTAHASGGGISLRRFSYEAPGESQSYENGRLVIAGVSDNRTTLIDFTKALRGVREFKEVVLPVSQLAQEQNISFSVTVPLNPALQ